MWKKHREREKNAQSDPSGLYKLVPRNSAFFGSRGSVDNVQCTVSLVAAIDAGSRCTLNENRASGEGQMTRTGSVGDQPELTPIRSAP